MDKKIFAVIAVVIIVVAAVAVYVGVGGGNDNGDDDTSGAYALSIGGVAATEENVVLGDYPIQRNLNLCTLGAPEGNEAAFISWILSTEGQEILGGMFVPLDSASETYTDPVGDVHLSIGGSTTIQPIMNELVHDGLDGCGSTDREVDVSDGVSVGLRSTVERNEHSSENLLSFGAEDPADESGLVSLGGSESAQVKVPLDGVVSENDVLLSGGNSANAESVRTGRVIVTIVVSSTYADVYGDGSHDNNHDCNYCKYLFVQGCDTSVSA